MSNQDEIYKQKYLKYKAKYLELKSYEQKGGLLDSGFAVVFTSKSNAVKLREAMSAGKIGGRGDIGDLLDRQAYIIFDGKKPAELLESTSRIMKEKLSSAAAVTAAVASKAAVATVATVDIASKAAVATVDIASKAATTTASAVVAAKDTAVDQYNKYQEQKVKESADKASLEQSKTQSIIKLFGGADLPLTIQTLDEKSFDRANEAHKKHIATAVATALGLNVSDVDTVSIKFKMFGKPELRD